MMASIRDEYIEREILRFFNSARSPDDIQQRIFDDPHFGSGPGPAQGITQSQAYEILVTRDSKYSRNFTELRQISDVVGIGTDTWHDILYSFNIPLKTGLRWVHRLGTHRLQYELPDGRWGPLSYNLTGGPMGPMPKSHFRGDFLQIEQPNGEWTSSSVRGPRGYRGPQGLVGPMPRSYFRGSYLLVKQPDGSWARSSSLRGPSRLLKNSRRNCPEKGVTEIK